MTRGANHLPTPVVGSVSLRSDNSQFRKPTPRIVLPLAYPLGSHNKRQTTIFTFHFSLPSWRFAVYGEKASRSSSLCLLFCIPTPVVYSRSSYV